MAESCRDINCGRRATWRVRNLIVDYDSFLCEIHKNEFQKGQTPKFTKKEIEERFVKLQKTETVKK